MGNYRPFLQGPLPVANYTRIIIPGRFWTRPPSTKSTRMASSATPLHDSLIELAIPDAHAHAIKWYLKFSLVVYHYTVIISFNERFSEPGILLMHHSLRAHPQITASLLDFLCRVSGSCTESECACACNFNTGHPDLHCEGEGRDAAGVMIVKPTL